MTFTSLGLSNALLKAIDDKGYTVPSPIQEKAIPPILEGRDVLASAQTGTGKTASFTLPVLQHLAEKPYKRRVLRALVLTPTRELAAQIYENIIEYSKYLEIRSTVIFGGVNANPQIRTLAQGVDFLVATPGRLLDLYSQQKLSFSNIDVFVLDEADRMLDMGFIKDINKIIRFLPEKRQNLMFSATFSTKIKKLAGGILRNPILLAVSPDKISTEMVSHKAYLVDKKKKTEVLTNLIKLNNWNQILIFIRTKHGANKLATKLNKEGLSALAIHGNKSQGARTKALADFKKNKIKILVATDIAARGLDIPLLPHVINFELPNVPEDYVHRIGRTGRAGAKGEAISLVCSEETEYQKEIEKFLKQELISEIILGYEPIDTAESLRVSTQKKSKSNKRKSSSQKSKITTNKRSKRSFT